METLEFIIYPDGRVQEKVTGIIGASCTEVTARITSLESSLQREEKQRLEMREKLRQSDEQNRELASFIKSLQS